jgi:hypothetical protein
MEDNEDVQIHYQNLKQGKRRWKGREKRRGGKKETTTMDNTFRTKDEAHGSTNPHGPISLSGVLPRPVFSFSLSSSCSHHIPLQITYLSPATTPSLPPPSSIIAQRRLCQTAQQQIDISSLAWQRHSYPGLVMRSFSFITPQAPCSPVFRLLYLPCKLA